MVSTAEALKHCQRTIADRHVRPDNFKAFVQCFTTLAPIALLWWAARLAAGVSLWLLPAVLALMSLFLLRVFVMMHECGHGSLFRTASLNRAFGFIFGVVSGMPQFVWSQHHRYHHSTNGNWARYRGPMNVIAVDEYAAMTARQQHRYRSVRNVWVSPVAGFLYLILNPRLTWLRGTVSLALHLLRKKGAEPGISARSHMRDFKATYCSSVQEYWHMLWNNVALLALWGAMAWAIGPILFFACYLSTLSIAGAVAIVLFTVQHNFEHSYASQDEGWDRNTAAIEGTSFLVLPAWLNWFTANIGYHHVHHLCASIPNYCLVQCHHEQRHLFSGVTRITLSQVPRCLRFILWDTRGRRLVSVDEHVQQMALGHSGAETRAP